MSEFAVGYEAIVQAAERLSGIARSTPLIEDELLNHELSGRVFFKCEPLQRTGSFKFRGAWNAISQIDNSPIVAFSSGNHAQGVALAARIKGFSATIVMPADTPLVKQRNTAALGAQIRLYDRFGEDRQAIAAEIAQTSGAVIVKPYDDPNVIAGQGTAGLEMAQHCEALGIVPDQAVICCGGGGLSAGVAIALNHHFPAIDLFTSEPEAFDDTSRSLIAGERLPNAPGGQTICDAIVTPVPGELTFPINQRLIKAGLSVSDHEVRKAMATAFDRLKLVVEPGGAVAMAAVLARQLPLVGRITLVVLSGGNVDPAVFKTALARGT